MLGISSAMFKSLNIRNYRLFFIGQTISVTGGWLQATAMPWLVYELTESAAMLGFVAFLTQIFVVFASPVAGSIADRFSRKKMIMTTQSILCISAATLAFLALTERIEVWHIIIIASVNGLVNAFDMTLRQSFILDLVPKNNLINAIGLNSLVFNSARIIGPSIAGVLIAKIGAGYCFLLNACSFLCALAALSQIRPLQQNIENAVYSIKNKFIEAGKFLKSDRSTAYLLLLLAIIGMLAAFPMVLIPVFVKDIYALGPRGLGIFMTSIGVGAIFATVTIASKTDIVGIKKIAVTASLFGGVFTILFGTVVNVYFACVFLAVMGFCMVLMMGLTNSYIQMTAPAASRTMIISFFIVAFMGLTPVGSILAGNIAQVFGAQITAMAGGLTAIITVMALRKKILK